jgi:hypothetical protein
MCWLLGSSRVMVLLVATAAAGSACKKREEPQPRTGSGSAIAAPASSSKDQISRADFNRFAVRLNLPVYWVADTNNNKALDPDEVAALLFYPTSSSVHWIKDGAFTPELDDAYKRIVAATKTAPSSDTVVTSGPEEHRRALVRADLDAGRPSLIRADLGVLTEQDKAFVQKMLVVAARIDTLFERANGAAAMASKVAADPESQSLFRRNRGIACVSAVAGKDPACSAASGAPKQLVDIYPPDLQERPDFCKALAAHKDAKTLLDHFGVVRGTADAPTAVPYNVAYKDEVASISEGLRDSARQLDKTKEGALVAYLEAAAASFLSNDWLPADRAWSAMNVDNSSWYVRVAPDEVYWEPCAEKAGFQLSFARINQGSRVWQQKLASVQQDMEAAIAAKAGPPYKARKVTFHLPDFIDIVVNAGESRNPLLATIGQSLPNWGKVTEEGKGRTVAMVNIGTDTDSRDARKAGADGLIDADSMKLYAASSTEPGLLSTILHEASHNLGPSHEYKVKGKVDSEVFTGPIASMLEELKAQTGAWFLTELLRSKGLITDELARQTYVDMIVWSFGHIAQGMYTPDKSRKAYGNLAAIHLGTLIEKGAVVWDAGKLAANGTDKGAFTIVPDKFVGIADEMMKQFGGIKSRGDRAAAEALIARFVDSDQIVPHKMITERMLRQGRPSYVYAVGL